MPEFHYDTTRQTFVKHCPKCKVDYEGGVTQELAEKNLSQYFSQDKFTRDGFYGRCKPCVSKHMRSTRGGRICNPEQMLADQDGKCALCPKELTFERNNQAKVWAYVDHDHETNKVRGILCPRCNTMLSQVEREGWVEKAIAYIQKYKCE